MLKYFIRLSPTVSLHTLPSLEVDLGATAEARKTLTYGKRRNAGFPRSVRLLAGEDD